MRSMRNIWAGMTLFAFAVVCSGVCNAADLTEPDKKLHAETSFYLTVGSYAGLRMIGSEKPVALLSSFLLPLAAGFLKEAIDERPSSKDMEANLAGIGTGLMIPILWEF